MQEGEEREKGAERIFEEIIAKNLTNLMKDININTQDVQQTLIDEQRHIPRHYNQTFKRQQEHFEGRNKTVTHHKQ